MLCRRSRKDAGRVPGEVKALVHPPISFGILGKDNIGR